MNVPEKHRAVAHAWVDGAEIEFRIGYDRWVPSARPEWVEDHDYRIKPKAKVKKWRWAWVNSVGHTAVSAYHYNEEGASKELGPDRIKLPWTEIEVEE